MAFGLFRSLKATMTGKVIHKIDVPIMKGVTASLRIKERKGDTPYVVMACLAAGNYQFYAMDVVAFRLFASAISETKDKLDGALTSN